MEQRQQILQIQQTAALVGQPRLDPIFQFQAAVEPSVRLAEQRLEPSLLPCTVRLALRRLREVVGDQRLEARAMRPLRLHTCNCLFGQLPIRLVRQVDLRLVQAEPQTHQELAQLLEQAESLALVVAAREISSIFQLELPESELLALAEREPEEAVEGRSSGTRLQQGHTLGLLESEAVPARTQELAVAEEELLAQFLETTLTLQ